MEKVNIKGCIDAFFKDVKLDLDIAKDLKDGCDKSIQIGTVNVCVDNKDIYLTNIPNPADDTFDFYNRINYYSNTDNRVQFSNNMIIILRLNENRIEFRFPIGKYLVEYFIFYDKLGFSMKVVDNSNSYTFEELVKRLYKCSISRNVIEKNKEFMVTSDLNEEDFTKVALQIYQDKEFVQEQKFIFEYLNIYYPNISAYLEKTLDIIKTSFIKSEQQLLDNSEKGQKFELNKKGIRLFLRKIKDNRENLKITKKDLEDILGVDSIMESVSSGMMSGSTLIGLMIALKFTNQEILDTIYNLAGTKNLDKDKKSNSSKTNKKCKRKI